MNHGPLIFLGVFATLLASWWGLIFSPQVQIGRQQPRQVEGGTALYPAGRPGLAEQGRAVYVSAGCVYCHSQQVHQEGYTFDVVLVSGGTNQDDALKAVQQIKPNLAADAASQLVAGASEQSPQPLLQSVGKREADAAQKTLMDVGANAQVLYIPLGADIRRGWGARLTVAQDFLYDYPVQVGHSRLGPDLANIGVRQPDADWHLRHLYRPRSEVEGSMMPAYDYLFEKRRIAGQPSPAALKLSGKFAPADGFEIVPRPAALHLVAYLQSLRADAPLFEAPMTQFAPAPEPDTNAAPAGATNAPAGTPQQ